MLTWTPRFDVPAAADHQVVVFQNPETVITGGGNGAIRWWNATSGKLLRKSIGPRLGSLALSSDGGRLATGHAGVVRVRRADNGELIRDIQVPAAAGSDRLVSCLAFLSAETIAAGWDDQLSIFDVRSGARLRSMEHSRAIESLASSRGDMVAITSAPFDEGKTLAVLDARNLKRLSVLTTVPDDSTKAAFSLDGKTLAVAAGSRKSSIVLFSIDRAEEARRIPLKRESIRDLLFGPATLFCTSGRNGSEGIVRCWDSSTAELLFELAGHQTMISSMAYNASSERLATADRDGTVLIWSLPLLAKKP